MEELFDVLTEKGEYTGKCETREKCHKEGLWHKAVAIFIINSKQQVLLQKRSPNKKMWPNMWDVTAGGHVLAGEFGFQSVIRETKEELGIEFDKNDITFIGSAISTNIKGDIVNNHFNEYYIVNKDFDETTLKLQEQEVSEVKWIDKNEIIERIKNNYEGITDKEGCWEYLLKYYEWIEANIVNKSKFAIIEIGSNNTKTHIYENDNLIYENNTTIEFKKNYLNENSISVNDLNKLFGVIEKAIEFTENVHIYGCSIFRNIKSEELKEINMKLNNKFNLEIQVVSQEEEAALTALGCYDNIKYGGNICVFIGGGGSIELIFVNNGNIIEKKYYDFGVVDVTKKFPTLKNDIPECTFDEVYKYINGLIGDLDFEADVLILAGGDHLYWYNNAQYKLMENTLYNKDNQKYMITMEMSDNYDKDALVTSLDKIRKNSDNPLWFDGSRAMKVITNLISHKINSKYIIPTKINMEDGLKNKLKQFMQ